MHTGNSAVDLEKAEESKFTTETADKKSLGKKIGGFFKSDKRWYNKLKSDKSEKSKST